MFYVCVPARNTSATSVLVGPEGYKIQDVTFSSKILGLLNYCHKSIEGFLQMIPVGKKGKRGKKTWCRVFPVK